MSRNAGYDAREAQRARHGGVSSPEAAEYAGGLKRTTVGAVMAALPLVMVVLIVVAPFVAVGVAAGLAVGVAMVPLTRRLRRRVRDVLRRLTPLP